MILAAWSSAVCLAYTALAAARPDSAEGLTLAFIAALLIPAIHRRHHVRRKVRR